MQIMDLLIDRGMDPLETIEKMATKIGTKKYRIKKEV